MKQPITLSIVGAILLWMTYLYAFEHDHEVKEVKPAKEIYFFTEGEVINILKDYLKAKKEKVPEGESSINLNSTKHRLSHNDYHTFSFIERGVELTLAEEK